MPGPTVPDSDAENAAVSSIIFTCSVHSNANDSTRLAHSGLHNSSSVTSFQQPPNLPIVAHRHTDCGTTAFSWNRWNAHLSTFQCPFVHIRCL